MLGPFTIVQLELYRDGSWSGIEANYKTNQKLLFDPSPLEGQWSFTALDNYRFHLNVTTKEFKATGDEFQPYEKMSGDFGIQDNDHIHNFEFNYIMERVAQ